MRQNLERGQGKMLATVNHAHSARIPAAFEQPCAFARERRRRMFGFDDAPANNVRSRRCTRFAQAGSPLPARPVRFSQIRAAWRCLTRAADA